MNIKPFSGGPQKRRVNNSFSKKSVFVLAALPLAVVVFLVFPAPAKAGFFSEIKKFFLTEEKTADLRPKTPQANAFSLPFLGGAALAFEPLEAVGGPSSFADEPLPTVQEIALIASRNPSGTISYYRSDEIFLYTVQPGDTPGLISDKFGISLNTLLWANNISNPNLIKAGDELVILPINGVRYDVKKGDTIESIAKNFRGDVSEILSFNGLAVGEELKQGTVLIIPDGEMSEDRRQAPPAGASRFSGLPELRGYFMGPIAGGRRSRGIHGFNGVDLANSCGLPVFASAEGTVILARFSGWNGGYGNYMVISHPNGVQTLYAHLSSVLGKVGQRVARGSQIAAIGSTGNSTGCHVHFEVRGAKNPF